MRFPDGDDVTGRIMRRLVRTALVGVVCAGVLLAGGRLAERIVLGPDDAAARVTVESEVRASFDGLAQELRDVARASSFPDLLDATLDGDVLAARRLFDAAAAALASSADSERGVTVFDLDGRPLAWAGRPSDLPTDRLMGDEDWFLTRATRGVRLVYVAPVTVGDPATRIGAIAAERAIVTEADGAASRYASRLATVSFTLPTDAPLAAADAQAFDVTAPSGSRLMTVSIAAADLERARLRWRLATRSIALVALALVVVLLAGPLLEWRRRVRGARGYLGAVASIAATVVAVRALFLVAGIADWWSAPFFSGTVYASALLRPLLSSPFDFLLTAATVGALVALLWFSVEALRLAGRARRRSPDGPARVAVYMLTHLVAGVGVALVLAGHQALLRDTVASTTVDLLYSSLHAWTAPRLGLQVGLILWHGAALACGVLLIRLTAVWWRTPKSGWRRRAAVVGCWVAPSLVWLDTGIASGGLVPALAALTAVAATALYAHRSMLRYHHGSQAFRLMVLALGLVVPSIAFYPSLFRLAQLAKSELVETRYAPQALNQRQTIQALLQQSLDEIDRVPDLATLLETSSPPGPDALTDRAFGVWQTTGLSAYPVTSSVELYDREGALISRFAFNLPEDLAAVPRFVESACQWDVVEEVAPFFADERRVLHAGRAVCDEAGRSSGAIVVHAMLDYANLPFISSQSPYVELLRPTEALRGEGVAGVDVEYAVYGWSGAPLYASSDRAWLLEDALFAQVQGSRDPVWSEVERADGRFDVYVLNDRFGIYALGFPVVAALDHLVNLAELTVLAWGTYLLLLVCGAVFGSLSRRGTGVRELLLEVRASFYRKLFLAFTAATVVPVAALALATSNYVTNELRANVEQEAARTASAARRVVEDLVAPRAVDQTAGVDDNLMVWVSRLIDQDVNVFAGPRLMATSERNLFASGLLPTRTPAPVYSGIGLRNEASTVTTEQVGALEYLVSATPMTVRQLDAILTVPLTSRQQEIEAQIDTLNRRVLLGALLFAFCGAGLGYWLAERIADPVNRLTRATRRIARGDLDARVATTSSDELRRLVHDFNSMAGELQRQQHALERTHRLEAWAEMARQVAHDIKNPLTPIQLHAEHLKRVHTDRGEPLTPVLQECVATILAQVGLLRQIASEFSSFASLPTARPTLVDAGELLTEIVNPYRAGLEHRIRFELDVPAGLPRLHIDRTLVGRALVNLVENALHAMPASGVISVDARAEGQVVRIRVSDTGGGMDAEALARAFEPYFSTKATGTGLGLPIAKRNVELSGGAIAIGAGPTGGITVEVTLPVANS